MSFDAGIMSRTLIQKHTQHTQRLNSINNTHQINIKHSQKIHLFVRIKEITLCVWQLKLPRSIYHRFYNFFVLNCVDQRKEVVDTGP